MLPIGKISVPCIDVNRLHTEIDAWNATLMKIYTNKQFQSQRFNNKFDSESMAVATRHDYDIHLSVRWHHDTISTKQQMFAKRISYLPNHSLGGTTVLTGSFVKKNFASCLVVLLEECDAQTYNTEYYSYHFN